MGEGRMWTARVSVLLLGISIALGCGHSGPERASVSGTIRVDGQPFEEGSINFIPVDGGPTAGAAIEKGEYDIDRALGPIVGKNRIEVRGNRKSGRKMPNPFNRSEMIDELVDAIPEEYNTKSTLIRDIKPGHNDFSFDLPGTKEKQ